MQLPDDPFSLANQAWRASGPATAVNVHLSSHRVEHRSIGIDVNNQ